MRACSGVTTSMITPPLSICARPALTLNEPFTARFPLRDPLRSATGRNSTPRSYGPPNIQGVGARARISGGVATLALLGASPVAAATDLSTLLAAPPGTDWVDIGPAADRLVGAFSSHDYALFLKAAGSSPGAIETELNLDGFTRGYGLEWEQ